MSNEEVKARAMILSFLVAFNTDLAGYDKAKLCALIAISEVIDCLSKYTGMYDQEFFDADTLFYKSVKEEINKL